jgi:hypothetical protein
MTARFTVEGEHRNILADRGRDILLGPADDIATFCRWLNLDPPADLPALRQRVLDLIMTARGGSFVMGEGIKTANDTGGPP